MDKRDDKDNRDERGRKIWGQKENGAKPRDGHFSLFSRAVTEGRRFSVSRGPSVVENL